MFKTYSINQTILPLDMEQYIPETDVAFPVNGLIEAMSYPLFHEVEGELTYEKKKEKTMSIKKKKKSL